MYALALALIAAVSSAPLVLENPALRLEVDPQVMAVRYIGPPAGPNLVEPLYVERRARRLKDWLDAGGVSWDISPGNDKEPALRRGPAEVLAHTATRIALLSPLSKDRMRLKLEFDLSEDSSDLRVTATLMTESLAESGPLALRCAFRLRPGTAAMSTGAPPPMIYSLYGESPPQQATVWDGILMQTGGIETAPIVSATRAPSATLKSGPLQLTREALQFPDDASAFATGRNLFAINDTRRHAYGLVMESPAAIVSIANPLVYREVWRVEHTSDSEPAPNTTATPAPAEEHH